MKANKRVDTGPELAVRRQLHKSGFRYRVDLLVRAPGLKRGVRPDIVFNRARLAVFIDGCFWHSCPEHAELPVSNRDFWVQKFDSNKVRDVSVTEALTADGWEVLRFWEHEDVQDVVSAIASALSVGPK